MGNPKTPNIKYIICRLKIPGIREHGIIKYPENAPFTRRPGSYILEPPGPGPGKKNAPSKNVRFS